MTERRGPEVAYSSSSQNQPGDTLKNLTDSELVERTLNGEDDAFEVLMTRYTPIVIGYLFGKTDSVHDTEDLGQEIFLKSFRLLKTLRNPQRFSKWLMRITRTVLIDYYRLKSRASSLTSLEHGSGDEGSAPVAHIPSTTADPAQEASTSQTRGIVMREIARLGEKYRLILYWRLIGEETTEEIARCLNVKDQTVRMRLYRGIRLLRKALKRKGITLTGRE